MQPHQKRTTFLSLMANHGALAVFILSSVFLEGSFHFRLVGLVLIFSFLIFYLNKPRTVWWPLLQNPPEMVLFTLWTLWVFVTLPFVSEFPHLAELRYKVQIQVVIIYWALYGIIRLKNSMTIVFLFILLAGALQGYFAYSGYVDVVSDSSTGDVMSIRMGGIGRVTNANALGLLMTRASLCAFFFWRHPFVTKNSIFRIVLILFLVLSIYIIVTSGSRKSSLFFAIVSLGWWGWALPQSSGIRGLLFKLCLFLFGFLIISFLLPNVMEKTAVGKRWMELFDEGGGTISGALEEDSRIHLARWGLELFKEKPIAGIGLGHYMMYNDTRRVSHNDYIETLSGTGIIGFALYQSMKVILGFRLLLLLFATHDPNRRYTLKVMFLMWLFIVMGGTGFHQYHDYQTIVLFATLFTYSWLWDIERRNLLSSQFNKSGHYTQRNVFP
jgi:hypothetical protein